MSNNEQDSADLEALFDSVASNLKENNSTVKQLETDQLFNAIDEIFPIAASIEKESIHLSIQWQKLFTGQSSLNEFKELAIRTQAFIEEMPRQTQGIASNALVVKQAALTLAKGI